MNYDKPLANCPSNCHLAAVHGGDENPDYDPEMFAACSSLTRRNLARLDESKIDYDLVEALQGGYCE